MRIEWLSFYYRRATWAITHLIKVGKKKGEKVTPSEHRNGTDG